MLLWRLLRCGIIVRGSSLAKERMRGDEEDVERLEDGCLVGLVVWFASLMIDRFSFVTTPFRSLVCCTFGRCRPFSTSPSFTFFDPPTRLPPSPSPSLSIGRLLLRLAGCFLILTLFTSTCSAIFGCNEPNGDMPGFVISVQRLQLEEVHA